MLSATLFSGKNLGYEVYKGIMGEELFKQKIEEFEKVCETFVVTTFEYRLYTTHCLCGELCRLSNYFFLKAMLTAC